MAATCLISVSSDGQLTVALLTFESQRQLCEVKPAHAGVSAIPGRDPKLTFLVRAPPLEAARQYQLRLRHGSRSTPDEVEH